MNGLSHRMAPIPAQPGATWMEVAVFVVVVFPWAATTGWWYVSLAYYVFGFRESAITTAAFGIKVLTIGDDARILEMTASRTSKPPLIVSRKPVTVSGGTTVVLPQGLDIKARYKGEQLEWARRCFPFDRTLYLDEDSLCDAATIPVADIVQFQEVPVTNSLFVGAIEAHRIGFQVEQALFEKTKPLYLWGGGVAVSGELEDRTTWDRETITEDTAFVFAARGDYSYKFSKQRIYNQAPSTVKDLIKQRHRWASGTYKDLGYLPFGWRKLFIVFRQLHWSLWPLYLLLFPLVHVPWWASLLMVGQMLAWSFVGSRIIGYGWGRTLATLALAPFATYVHSIGAAWALFKPREAFKKTPKRQLAGDELVMASVRQPVLQLLAEPDGEYRQAA